MSNVLYSFRRCPYAIRARFALDASAIAVELREVALRHKPDSMLSASPKGSVPVLVLPDQQVIDESWDIMLWALQQHDPETWLGENAAHLPAACALISENDTSFKQSLDSYKYPERYPQQSQVFYRSQAELFLQKLEERLSHTPYLLGDSLSIADVGVFPFVRQFASVDKIWFAQSPYSGLRRWLNEFLNSERYAAVMQKYPPWQLGDTPVYLTNRKATPC